LVISVLTAADSVIKCWEMRIEVGEIERTGDGSTLKEKLKKTTDSFS
jgi:hypothetical protein